MDKDDNYFEFILKALRSRYGIDFCLYRASTIRRRMARRMAARGFDTYRAYFCSLEEAPHEYAYLMKDLTIKVSRFFRNHLTFDFLSKEILPAILREKKVLRDDTLRIWCAGCASGEEVYSICITLMECFEKLGESVEKYHVSIFGTDIDEGALSKAMTAAYSPEALRETRLDILSKYFIRTEEAGTGWPGKFTCLTSKDHVIEPVKNLAHFCIHDLASKTRKSPPAGIVANYDLILCRNLLIYFSKPLQERAFSNLISSLNPGGYLVLGKAESIPEDLEAALLTQDSSKRVYRKSPKPLRQPNGILQ